VSGAVAAATVTLLVGGVANAQTPYPVRHSLAEGVVASAPDPAAPPPGVNVPACQMTAAHPRPIVLVNGTFANMTDDWSGLGPTLANEGYCVYSAPIGGNPNHIVQTTGPVEDSAKEISLVVDDVLAQTGAAQVDLVGHSQGGLISEYYTKILDGAAKIHTLVGLSPSTHGTTLNGLGNLAMAFPGGREVLHAGCAACADQVAGSDVLAKVDDGPIAQPGIDYTIIETRNESVVTPAGSSFIDEPGVRNLWVQDYCSTDTVDHAGLPYDPTTQTLVENALDPADPRKVDC
jgi:triacylglycerol esterase/lipase EstA (alpha/beta hydrolase family)